MKIESLKKQFAQALRMMGVLLLALSAAMVQAVALDSLPVGKKSVLDNEAKTAKFLPVEQAYQLTGQVHGSRLLLDWVVAPGYYLYRERMKLRVADAGEAPLLFSASAGTHKYDDYFERDTEVFYKQVTLTLPLSALPSPVFSLQVESQGCADAGLCYPPQTQFLQVDTVAQQVTMTAAPVSKPAATAPVAVSAAQESPQTESPSGIWVLLMAMLGGLILNLMPCVFPVLSLKIFAMSGHSDDVCSVRKQSWVYTLGVVLSFVLAAALMLALREAGAAVGWGFQLQEPLFICLLVYLFFVLGLSFSGIVHIGGSLMGIGQQLVAGNGMRSAFFTGVLAVVVASPCSAPFMGVALGYAVTQSALFALLVFAALGFGMALPFVLLAYWPQLLRRLPAPGAWMVRLQQFLAFPLYATGIWLLYVLGQQAGQAAILWILSGLVLLAMAGWLWRDAAARWWEKILAVIVLLLALLLPPTMARSTDSSQLAQASPSQQILFEEIYSAERLAALRAEGKPVFVNLTAAWCITCLINDKTALNRDSVQKRLRERGITYMKGDWTHRDPEITGLLSQFGRNGVPLYLYFPAGKASKVQVLPQVLSEESVLEVLK